MAIKERLILAVAIIIASGLLSSLYAMSDKQIETIRMVKKEAKKYTRYPSTIAAMCIVESSAGKNRIGDDRKSLGLLHIQVATVRWLSGMYESIAFTKKLSDYDVEKLLLSNDSFSIEVASLYINHYMDHGWGYTKSVMVYNGGVNNWTYYRKVMEAKKIARGIN